MNWQPIAEFAHKHQEGLGLFTMAMIVTMRPKLPWPFCLVESLEWGYEWLREGLLTLLSFKGPLPHPPSSQSSERVLKGADGTVESVKETSVTGATGDVAKAPVA